MGGRHLNDITGQRFGMLTAIRPTDQRKNRTVVWECVCDCGNTAYVTLGHLKSGSTKSCGCLRQQGKNKTGLQPEILEGMRFGRLTVARPAEGPEKDASVWECLCDCGNTVFAKDVELRKGSIESCGCLKRERAAERCLERNKDMVGQRFGRLTAIRPTGEVKSESMVWECLCDCGNTAFVIQRSLKSGSTKSCGCLRSERGRARAAGLNLTQIPRKKPKPALRNGKDLSGQRFGKLTVIQPTEERKRHRVIWECKCDCGNTVKFSAVQLTTIKNISCGCERVQNPSQMGKSIEGKRFGRLTAIRPTEERKNNSVVWECICDCGNTVLENQVALARGRTLSCGCMKKEQEQMRLEALTKENAGKRFGRLTILRAVTEDGSSQVKYVCRCDCGNEIYAQLTALERGLVKSCGCLIKDFGKQKLHDLTGQRFGYLTVVRKTDERRNRAVVWECKCVCGKTTYVAASTLKRGNTKSCGCKGKGKPQENG